MPEIKALTPEQEAELDGAFLRAGKAMAEIENYSQEQIDRLCQAVAWAVANKVTFKRLVDMGIEESRLGDPVSRMNKRMKIRGVLRDALRQKSVGIIEEIPEKGIVKYAKPAGIIGCLIPTTNPDLNSVLGPGAIIWPGQHVLWVRHGGDERLDCVDPASGKVLQTWPEIQGPVSSVAGAAYAVHNGLVRRLTLESSCSG